jgi:porphobilinogen deaminase
MAKLRIGIVITPKVREDLIALLRDYIDIFVWSYKDMPGG